MDNKKRMFEIINKTDNKFKSKYINEGYVFKDSNNDFNFQQELNNSKFNNYEGFSSDYDISITQSNIIINWNLVFWLNNNGIENISVNTEEIKLDGFFTINMFDKQSQKNVQNTEKNISEFNWKFQLGEFNLSKGKSLYINSLDFDFSTNVCKINFI